MMETANLRKAYGEALVEAGKSNRDIVVLEADLGKSTMSALFKEAFPERYFEMGIAEQNMTAAAAGFALAGKIPFTGTFAVFAAGRAYDQIRCSVAIPGANVKIVGSSCGLSDYNDGKTHQSVEDANIVMAIPNMTVLNPCDAVELRKMLRAMIRYRGPVYLRINRNDLPVYTPPEGEYEIGRIYPVTLPGRKAAGFTPGGSVDNGSAAREKFSPPEAAVFATGVMVRQAVEAAERLYAEGIAVRVLNVSTLKPLIPGEVLKYAAGKRAVVTAEEAVKTGGLGAAIASVIMGKVHVPFEQVAIGDSFGASALAYDELLEHFGLGAGDVYRAVKKALTNEPVVFGSAPDA
jgi:transketolase